MVMMNEYERVKVFHEAMISSDAVVLVPAGADPVNMEVNCIGSMLVFTQQGDVGRDGLVVAISLGDIVSVSITFSNSGTQFGVGHNSADGHKHYMITPMHDITKQVTGSVATTGQSEHFHTRLLSCKENVALEAVLDYVMDDHEIKDLQEYWANDGPLEAHILDSVCFLRGIEIESLLEGDHI